MVEAINTWSAETQSAQSTPEKATAKQSRKIVRFAAALYGRRP
jgi:hypothetical protein